MALQCQVLLNVGSCSAGQTPPPQATVFVYNPNAVAVVVTGLTMTFADQLGRRTTLAVSPCVPPIGPGMTTSVPTLSSINIGPFPITIASAANVNSFTAVNQTGNLNPVNPQGSQPPQFTVLVGAAVNGSDGSSNIAGVAPLLVSYTSSPPLGYQGGFLQFASPNNFIGFTPGWP